MPLLLGIPICLLPASQAHSLSLPLHLRRILSLGVPHHIPPAPQRLKYKTLIFGEVLCTSKGVERTRYLSSPCSSCSPLLALTYWPLPPPFATPSADEAAVKVSREATTVTEVFSRLPLPPPSSQVGFASLESVCHMVIPPESPHFLSTFSHSCQGIYSSHLF